MRLWILSDLHDDYDHFDLPTGVEADVCIIAGDVGGRLSGEGRLWLERNTPADMPTIVVAGNHCFYGADLHDEIDRFRRKTSAGERISVLDGESTVIGGTRFVGATLWTDFEVAGDAYRTQKEAVGMSDYATIRRHGRKTLQPIDLYREHARQLDAIRAILSTPFQGPTVVVTHHAPSPRSLEHGRATCMLDGAYASDLSELILEHEPDMWIHGHVHRSQDYMLGKTRIVANPRGYITRRHSLKVTPHVENPAFDPSYVVDLQPRPQFDWATIEHTLDYPEIYGLPPKPEVLPHDEAVRRLQAIRDRFAADPNLDDKAVDRYIAENPSHFPDDEDKGSKGPGRR